MTTIDKHGHHELGVSVESQRYAEERIPDLIATPAALRFLSCEPLLGPLDLAKYLRCPTCNGTGVVYERHDYCEEPLGCQDCRGGADRISWVIVGSESGPGARSMDTEWARSIVGQCAAAGVACFVKQIATDAGRAGGNKKGGDPQFWPSDLRVREFPTVRT